MVAADARRKGKWAEGSARGRGCGWGLRAGGAACISVEDRWLLIRTVVSAPLSRASPPSPAQPAGLELAYCLDPAVGSGRRLLGDSVRIRQVGTSGVGRPAWLSRCGRRQAASQWVGHAAGSGRRVAGHLRPERLPLPCLTAGACQPAEQCGQVYRRWRGGGGCLGGGKRRGCHHTSNAARRSLSRRSRPSRRDVHQPGLHARGRRRGAAAARLPPPARDCEGHGHRHCALRHGPPVPVLPPGGLGGWGGWERASGIGAVQLA